MSKDDDSDDDKDDDSDDDNDDDGDMSIGERETSDDRKKGSQE